MGRHRAEDHRRVLLEAATAEFAANGYADTPVAAIIGRAHVSYATFYAHFDNRLDCLLATLSDLGEALLGAVAPIVDQYDDNRERTRSMLEALFVELEADPDRARLLLFEVSGGSADAVMELDRLLEGFAGLVERTNRQAVEAGHAPEIPLPDWGRFVAWGLYGVVTRAIREDRLSELREPATLDATVDTFFSAMQAMEG